MKSTSKLAKIDLAVIAAERTPDIFEARKAACKALREFAPAAVKAVEDAVNSAVVEGRRVYATVEQLVEQLGRVDLAAVIGALVLMHSTDGRIDPRAVEWARRTQYAPELAATDRVDTYRLHMAHLDNLASALMRWEREHPVDAEPVEAEPVQVVEAEAVEAAPAADPAPVAAEAAPAEAEPVKVARKARKPRKAAVVAAEPVEVVPAADPVAVAAEPVKMAAAGAQTVQVVEAEPVRSVAAAAAVVPASEVLSVPASVDPVAAGGWNFGASSVEVSGRVLPVSYSVTRSDEVYAFTALDGVAVRLHIGKGDTLYTAALAAARGEAEARKAARMEPVKMAPVGAQAVTADAEPVEAEAVAVEPIEAVPAADPAPVAADPAPVVAEAAPAEAEPVKAGRKARKPRKAAPVAAEPVSVGADPIEAAPVTAEAEAVAVDPIEAVTVGAEPVEAEPVQVVEAEAVAADAEPVEVVPVGAQTVSVGADPAPVAVDPVPAAVVEGCAQGKSWAGSSIVGDGWRIVFDAVEERTRVICAAPTDAQKAAIEGAGFWWSPRMKSWNKKLTCKAYRAAVALAEELRRIA